MKKNQPTPKSKSSQPTPKLKSVMTVKKVTKKVTASKPTVKKPSQVKNAPDRAPKPTKNYTPPYNFTKVDRG